ncbi:MAG: hypothetical protein IJC18_02160 [Clostridia bacterium]|nr:hypothetical protein [Clostridia bacterium]
MNKRPPQNLTDSDRRAMLIMIACVAAVLVIFSAYMILLRSDSCKSEDAPPTPPTYTDSATSASDASPSDASASDAETAPAIVVTVQNADGVYHRTNVKRSEAMSLTVVSQNGEGFDFTLSAGSGDTAVSLVGRASFYDETSARADLAESQLNFTFDAGGIRLYQTARINALGDMLADGTYILGEPAYIEEAVQQAQTNSLDADIRNTQTVSDELKRIMSVADYDLMHTLFESGNCPVYEGPEKGYDKNGKEINIDSELKAVKYYAFIQGTGQELILICTTDGKVYIGICDGAAYRYYTNDDAYKTKAPVSITGQAETKSMTLSYQNG